MNQLLDLLHLLLCEKPHSSDILSILERTDTLCYYYLENDISEGGQMSDHLNWAERLDGFKLALNLKDSKEALEFLQDCLKLSHKIQDLSGGNKSRRMFIKQLIEL